MYEEEFDLALEKRLAKLDPQLSQRYSGCVFVFENMLKRYTAKFPNFTDHTLLHAMNVARYSNYLLGSEVNKLSADEIYCYLMGVLIHDAGMGVSGSIYDEFCHTLGIAKLIKDHPEWGEPDIIRKFHNDFSYCFTMKYYELFDIPDESYALAIAMIGRAHRKVDLLDTEVTPRVFALSNGSEIHIPDLGALIRVADELDMGSDRNPDMLYGDEYISKVIPESQIHFRRHELINSIVVEPDRVVFDINNKYPEMNSVILDCISEVWTKHSYYIQVTNATGYLKVNQKKILVTNDSKPLKVFEE